MAYNPALTQCSSLATILNSIVSDAQVFRWFLLLIEQPHAQKMILGSNSQLKMQYLQLRTVTFGQALILILLILLLWFWSGDRQMPYLLVSGALILLLWRIHAKKRRVVATLSEALLLANDTPQSLSPKTLYQIAEIYSREYQIPSLVDTIFHWDKYLQSVFLCLFVVYNFIWPMAFIPFFATLLVGLFLAQSLLRLNAIYKRLT